MSAPAPRPEPCLAGPRPAGPRRTSPSLALPCPNGDDTSTVEPALPKACAHCPWRVSNQGKPTADGFYTKANLRRLWSGLRSGEAMTCHPTDPRMNAFESAPRVSLSATTHECAGSMILVQRELVRVQDAEDWKTYRGRPGPRLTMGGAAEHVARMIFGGTPMGGAKVPRLDLNDAEVQYAPLGYWTPISQGEKPS